MALPQIDFEPVEWSNALAAWLGGIDGVERDIQAMKTHVETGEFQALSIRADGVESGVLIYSVEHEPGGAVIVANALAGRIRGVDLTVLCLNLLAEMGRKVGAVGVRCWTNRRGLVRKCENMGLKARYVIEGAI